jgi:hypothetical protein
MPIFHGVMPKNAMSFGSQRWLACAFNSIKYAFEPPLEFWRGLFSGTKSSNSTDGGTSSRVFESFISWMQEKKAPVFVVATANDVSQLPPEMLRKGRFDELMFVDLPNQAEREAIWTIQIGKYRRDPKDFDTVQPARATEGLTGSEIENVFVDALFKAFELGKEPTDLTVAEVLTEFVPLSKLMAEQMNALFQYGIRAGVSCIL